MIPKIIHQLWIGPKPAPTNMMNTWKNKHPDFTYMFWNEDSIKERNMIFENQHRIDQIEEINGKADIMRYEILLKYGGVFQDADSFCINKLDDYLLNNEAFSAFENEEKRGKLVACGTMGFIPNYSFLRHVIDYIKDHEVSHARTKKLAWRTVGPLFFTDMINKYPEYDIKIYPSYFFIPDHYTGHRYNGHHKIYAHQEWGSTNKNYLDLSKKVECPTWLTSKFNKDISILIPSYNSPKGFLEECFESILIQDVEANLEVVFVDDGSDEKFQTDCKELIEHYKTKSNNVEWKYIQIEKNAGVGNALRIGLDNCKHEFVARMDADDKMMITRLKKQLDFMEKNNECVVLGTGIKTSTGKSYSHPSEIRLENFLKKTSNWFTNHPTVMFRKSKILEVGSYKKMDKLPEDLELWLRVLEKHKVIHNLQEDLLWYRIHPNQISKKYKWNDTIKKWLREFQLRNIKV